MERGHDEYWCLSLSLGDLQLLQSVSEVFFEARENDEETVDSDSESSSSDSCDDLKDTQALDFDFLEIQASEKLVFMKVSGNVGLKVVETRHLILGVTTKDKLTIKPGPQWWEWVLLPLHHTCFLKVDFLFNKTKSIPEASLCVSIIVATG